MTARLALAFALLAGVAPAAPVPKELKKKETEADIVGLWASRPGGTTGWWFGPDGNAGTGNPQQVACKAIYKTDPTQSPKHLDWSQDGGKTWHLAVYEIENDVLKINFGAGGSGVRPAAVGPNLGSQYETGTLNRDWAK